MAILAAGVGFALRGGIFDNWGKEFNFTATQLGAIGGAGFSGFCFGIIIGGLIVDKIGYGKLVAVALLCHIISAFVTFGASNPHNAYNFLYWGMFIFAYANGTLEAVANPLVATLFPQRRTHYLNILHASWPAGMVLGTAAGWVLDDKMNLHWKYQLALYLVPTALYAFMFLGQKFPKSEAAEKGASFVQMFKSVGVLGALVACFLLALFFGDIFKGLLTPDNATEDQILTATKNAQIIGYSIGGILLIASGIITRFSIGSILLFVLFVTHLLVGAVELGTDGWIQNITGNLFTSEQGKYLFIWTSAIMFGLRFCAHWIETKLKLSPVGLLLLCATIACIGLNLSSGMKTLPMAFVALGIYAIGKTFFWPTMLAIVGDRFPHTGAVAMSIMGGIGMLSAGLIGGPGLGYSKDRFAGEELNKTNPAVYAEYKAEKPSTFLNIKATEAFGLDAKKLAAAKEVKEDARSAEQKQAIESDQKGDRTTLRIDSFIPATMAVIYLLLLIYFKGIGGYKVLHIDETAA
ncbi:MFS transporter [Luteolibacter ambystomatis]|uniref:MFS transporter n=1 Tax=Luteolibacter ambystomatis TaxID=2824561 RepID=A0A975G623_9BACT|nr:MFS transporter [Luteolibacter ambystomatis]QUE49999.1 MFS transporter [Luteolibacter ambystomatis]